MDHLELSPYRKLAASVLLQALNDLGSSDKAVKLDSLRFFIDARAARARELWCAWAGISPEALFKAAIQRLS